MIIGINMKLLKLQLIIILLTIIFPFTIQAQEQNQWDDTKKSGWPEQFKEVNIPSTMDGSLQKAYFYRTTSDRPQPLIVSLHTWSGDYQQKDPLIQEIMEKDYNYIHPDFRGPNYTQQACGSHFVIADIDDAISYGIEKGNVDLNNIHIIGVSGGGYATLLTYMQSRHKINPQNS